MNHILITGATGVIGSALLAELLKRETTDVTILIRANDDEHLAQRALELLGKLEIPANEIGRRVHLVRGDITQPNLGIEDEQYKAIQSKCTHFVHSAGKVKLNQSLEEARSNSLFTARQIIAFANGASNLKKGDILSTIGIAGCMEGQIPETRITQHREFHNTYEQSKAEAEELYWEAIRDGLPISIHRPSMVVGDSQTGNVMQHQVFYHLCDFLSGRKTLGILPNFETQMLDIVPVDYAVQCIITSLFSKDSIGRVFHLCTGPAPELQLNSIRSSVRRIYSESGRPCLQTLNLSTAMFRFVAGVLSKVGSQSVRRSATNLPLFLNYLGKRQVFDKNLSEQWFGNRGVYLPEPGDYIHRVIRQYLDPAGAYQPE